MTLITIQTNKTEKRCISCTSPAPKGICENENCSAKKNGHKNGIVEDVSLIRISR